MTQGTDKTPVEVTTRYVTTVAELGEAWAFIMDRIERVGPDPSVHIHPVWCICGEGDKDQRMFEVIVEGMVEEP